MGFKDYDALSGAKEPIRFKVAGETHELPPELPAKLILDVRRKAKTITDEEAEDFGFQVVEGVIGKERWERIVASVGIETLTSIIEDVMAAYGFGGDDPKAEEPEREPSPSMPSSSTSEPSTQTSNVFGLYPLGDSEAAS